MRCSDHEDEKDRLRVDAGMGGVVVITVVLLLAQLQLDGGLLFAA